MLSYFRKLTHDFLYDIFNKKILINCHTKTHVSIFMHVLYKMAHLYFPKMEALRSESDKYVLSKAHLSRRVNAQVTWGEVLWIRSGLLFDTF